MNALYDIHGLALRIRGLADAAVPDINTKLHWFEIPDDGRPADIDVAIGDFEPRLQGCLTLDRRYWAGPGYLYLEESDKGLAWRADVEGLDGGPSDAIRIRFAHRPPNRRRIPWRLFPDLVMHLYVLWPILECRLAARGLYLVHAGAVERDGRALLVAGRGGTNKSALVAELVRRRWRPMSDDFVLLRPLEQGGADVLAFPTSPRWFEFQVRYKVAEDLSLVDKARLLWFLYRKRRVGLEFVRQARLERLVILQIVNGGGGPQSGRLAPRAAAESLELNCRMERTSYVGHGTIIGRFLEAYRYVVPESAFGCEWDGLGGALERMLAGAAAHEVVAGRRFERRLADVVESL